MALKAGVVLLVLCVASCGWGEEDGTPTADPSYPPLAFQRRALIGGAGAEGAGAFGKVVGAAISGDTLLAVADGWTQRIHLFDLDGRHIRSVAGEGEGPGRARSIRFVSFAVDGGVCVWDRQLSRVTRFGPTGSVVAEWTPTYGGSNPLSSRLVGLDSDCTGAVFADRIRPGLAEDVGEVGRGMVEYVDTVVYTAVGWRQPALELSRRPTPPVWLLRSRRLNSLHEVVLGERLRDAVVGATLWFGITDSLRWWRVGAGGTELSPVRLPSSRTPSTARDIELARNRMKEAVTSLAPHVGEVQARQFMAAQHEGIDRVPASPDLPAYEVMIAGADGTLWVREASPVTAETNRWLLLDSEGFPLGRVSLPAGGDPVAGSSAVLVLRRADALGAEYLEVYGSSRPSATAPPPTPPSPRPARPGPRPTPGRR